MAPETRGVAMIERARTFADLHFYQKWRAVWPRLAGLTPDGLRILDAGCGDGRWSTEIARRRPGWKVMGVDRDAAAVQSAQRRSQHLNLSNLTFEQADFSQYVPAQPFDVVLSICSTHYEPSVGETEHLFQRMHEWLAPTGEILLLVPRRLEEAPFVGSLPRPKWHDRFSREALATLCDVTGFTAELIAPRIGRLGTFAKQLDWTRARVPAAAGSAVGVLAKGLALVGTRLPASTAHSLMWLLVARRRTLA